MIKFYNYKNKKEFFIFSSDLEESFFPRELYGPIRLARDIEGRLYEEISFAPRHKRFETKEEFVGLGLNLVTGLLLYSDSPDKLKERARELTEGKKVTAYNATVLGLRYHTDKFGHGERIYA